LSIQNHALRNDPVPTADSRLGLRRPSPGCTTPASGHATAPPKLGANVKLRICDKSGADRQADPARQFAACVSRPDVNGCANHRSQPTRIED
jgi:hypothetical protein